MTANRRGGERGRQRPALDHTESGNRERPGLCGRLFSPDHCVVALIDHQPQMVFGVAHHRDTARDR